MTTETLRPSEGHAPIDTFYHPVLERPEGILSLQEIIGRGQFTNEDMFKSIADMTNILAIEEDEPEARALGRQHLDNPDFPFDLENASWTQTQPLYHDHLIDLNDFEVGLDRSVDGEDGPREETAWILFEDSVEIEAGEEWASRFVQYDFKRNAQGGVRLEVHEAILRDGDGDSDKNWRNVTRSKEMTSDEKRKIGNEFLHYLLTAPVES